MQKVSLDTSIVRRCSSLNDSDLELEIFRWGPSFVMKWEKKWHPKQPRETELNALEDVSSFKPIIDASIRGEILFCLTPPVKFELGDETLLSFYDVALEGGEVHHIEGPIPKHWKRFYPPNVCGVVPADFNPIMTNSERKVALEEMIDGLSCPRFQNLRSVVGDAHLVDLYILWLSNEAECDILLTSDYKFKNFANKHKHLNTLRCKVCRPHDLNVQENYGPADKAWTVKVTNLVKQQRVYQIGTYVFPNRIEEPTIEHLLNDENFTHARPRCDRQPTQAEIIEAFEKCMKNSK